MLTLQMGTYSLTVPELCDCGQQQTVTYVADSCQLTKLDGGQLAQSG